ncbi:hypothetical protein ABFS83_08G166100 [Erythranthe nasuta]
MARNHDREDLLLPPLFETSTAKHRGAYKIFCFTIFVGVISIWLYRFIHFPSAAAAAGKSTWLTISAAEVLFGLYWIFTQAARLNVVYRFPFKHRLSQRYEEELPLVDVFVCTADPTLEPPLLVIDTILSVMSYNYTPEKLGIYLSDDGCSELTFYALVEASEFAKRWIPFVKKHNVEPRAPRVYFSRKIDSDEPDFVHEWTIVKDMYEDMKSRIDSSVANGFITDEIKDKHKGFLEWNSNITKNDHHSIVQILINGWDPQGIFDADGNRLPTLVYLSREKRRGWQHNFKAGSMNALIRVSSEITNAPIILNLDCDMYSNDPDAIRDALCFFLDENQGQQISYVQYPQRFSNITKNDIYANEPRATFQIELAGLDGFGATLYIGTGCFHRRESLSGKKFSYEDRTIESNSVRETKKIRSVEELELASKILANCSYEKDTLWGKEMGLVYGYPVEDIVTGLTIQCRGWKPVYYNPTKHAFLGIAPTTLDVALVQFKRWSEGLFQIFFSEHCPFIHGCGKIKLGAQMGYCIYLLWAPFSLPILAYVFVPALCLLHDVPLFPKVSSLWFVPFAYVFAARTVCSLIEDLISGSTVKGWWNLQRMWLIRRTTSYFFALIDTIYKKLGLSETSFVLTGKVSDEDLRTRYEDEIIEFGSSSVMYVIIATIAIVNLLSLVYGVFKNVIFSGFNGLIGVFTGQMIVCGIIVSLNLPVYEALLMRRDKGSIPSSVLVKSLVITSLACLIPMY